jgi:hypothetical protein
VSGLVVIRKEKLTVAQFEQLTHVPPEVEWVANITNSKTRRVYKVDVEEFSRFTGLTASAQLRSVTRAHIIAWRKFLEAQILRLPAFGASPRLYPLFIGDSPTFHVKY